MALPAPVTSRWKVVGIVETATWVWLLVAVVVVVLIVLLLATGRRRKAMQQKRDEAHREKAADIRREAADLELDAREREAKAARARADAEQAQVDAARLRQNADQRTGEAQSLREDVAERARKADDVDPDVKRDGASSRRDDADRASGPASAGNVARDDGVGRDDRISSREGDGGMASPAAQEVPQVDDQHRNNLGRLTGFGTTAPEPAAVSGRGRVPLRRPSPCLRGAP